MLIPFQPIADSPNSSNNGASTSRGVCGPTAEPSRGRRHPPASAHATAPPPPPPAPPPPSPRAPRPPAPPPPTPTPASRNRTRTPTREGSTPAKRKDIQSKDPMSSLRRPD